MIRWRYVLIRLALAAGVVMLVRWSAGPLTQYVAVRTLQSATGAKVEIAEAKLGLFPPCIHLRGVAVADPRKEMRNAFEAEHIHLAIDGNALVRRRYEISEGRVSGIRIGGVRTESGRLEVVSQEPTAESEGPSQLQQWCLALAGDAQQQAETLGNSLATVVQSKRIRADWEAEYERLRSEAKQLETDIRALKSTARSVDNPLRDLPALQDSLRRAEEIRQRLKKVTQDLDTLPHRFQTDMQSLDRALQQDKQRVAAYFPEGLNSSPTEVGPALLGELVRTQIEQVRGYLQSGRAIAQATVASPQPQRARGETISLNPHPRPAWLVRKCAIDGYMSIDSEEYTMLGVVENVTSDTANLRQPLHARLRLNGPRVVRIDYHRHFNADLPRDELRVHWPSLDLPATRIGKSQLGSHGAALRIDGGNLELWVEIEAEGDRIEGRLVSKQTGTQVDLRAGEALEETVVVQALRSGLREIDHVDIDATFAGSWRRMDLDISTNLTNCVADSLRQAVEAQVAATRQRLAGEVQRAYDQQSGALREWVSEQQSEARLLVAGANASVEEMSQKVVAELGAADAYLGKLRSGLGRAMR